MDPSALPLISEADYPAFQHIIPELRHTSYQEWQDDHLKAIAYRRQRNGSREVSISPEDFRSWLNANRTEPHLELLWVCAEDMPNSAANMPRRSLS